MPPASSSPPGLLIVGNLISATRGGVRQASEDLADRLEGVGWRVIRTSHRLMRIPRLMDMMSTAWKRRDEYQVAHVDVFSGSAFVWSEAVCAVLRRANKPYVLTLRGGSLPVFARRWPERVRRLFQSAAAVTAPSRFLAEGLRAAREDLMVMPNSLDLSRFEFKERLRARPRLVWLRAFHPIYAPSVAIWVMETIASEFPEAHLTMVGPDRLPGTLAATQRVVDQLGAGKHVRLVPGVPASEVPRYLNEGDIFLNTTTVDNTPVSVLQAMACGLCVVSTDVGGIPYLLDHEQDSLLVPPREPQTMAACVRRILTEDGLSARLSRTARSHAEEFDWQRTLPRWDQLLRSVAQDRRPLAAS
jgi:glycosyltransferase involved in cell wall biosynthesis